MKALRKTAALLMMIITLGMVFTGCGINEKAVLVNINNGEEEVSAGYANFLAHFTQAEYEVVYLDYFGGGMWSEDMFGTGNTAYEDVKDNIIEQIVVQHLLKKHASDYGVEITEKDTKAIKKAAKKFMSDNSEEALKQMGAKKEYVEQLLTNETIAVRTQQAIIDEADVEVTDADREAAGEDVEDADILNQKKAEYYDEVISGWKAEIIWKVDEKLWEKVNFNYHYSSVNVEETAEETED